MAGGDLFDYLERRNHFVSEARAKEIFRQIAESIRFLHSLGIVHRDLKIENVMMSSNAEDAIPKLVDFGLACILAPGETSSEGVGTLEYCAPEIIFMKNYNHCIDIWSLGCVLFRLICGDLPFEDDDKDKLAYRIAKGQYTFD